MADVTKTTKIEDLEFGVVQSGFVGDEWQTTVNCAFCESPIIEGLTDHQIAKVRHWTVAQLIAWKRLQARSGIGVDELLAKTSGGVMPGIGGALYGDTGTIGVSDFHGMFVGIEPDGHTHS